jgi:hypothetical protein
MNNYVLDNAVEVEVSFGVGGGSREIYHFNHEGRNYRNERSKWQEKSKHYKGQGLECYLCTSRRTGKHFWTRTVPWMQTWSRNTKPRDRRAFTERDQNTGRGHGRVRKWCTVGTSSVLICLVILKMTKLDFC